ncbi:MAG: hypothetical protein Q8N28_03355 [bacterium]|nr:hypothetical protein [bacterium]
MSQKIQLKNILTGVAIGLFIMFLIFLILYYILVFLPDQETKKLQKSVDEFERFFLEHKKVRQIIE